MKTKKQIISDRLRDRITWLDKSHKNKINVAYNLLDDVEQFLFDKEYEEALIYTSTAMHILECIEKGHKFSAGQVLLYIGMLN